MTNDSKTINRRFDEEIRKWNESPPNACECKTALKLLREFERDSIDFATKFWPDSVEKYLPAVVEGSMFVGEEPFLHEEAFTVAKSRVEKIPYQKVAHAFLYGIAKGIPAYRTALPAYLHIKNILEHGDEHLSDDTVCTSPYCDFCDYRAPSPETKMSFMWINSMQYTRIYGGGYLGLPGLTDSSFLLREFLKMPDIRASKDDYRLFLDSLKLAESLPGEKKVGAYKELLQKSKMLPFKAREYPHYLDILGYLDILHTERHHGMTKQFLRARDMEEAEDYKNDYGYPVRFWRAENGVDLNRVHELFDGLFESVSF